jgi:DNA repair protein RadC
MKYEGMMVKETATNILITTPEAIYEVFKDSAKLAQETFSIATLNAKNKIIGEHLITIGIVNSSLVHPRECFRPAILDGATSIILSHNHPSGDTTPSSEDIKITRQLISAGEILGIKVIDHVIIGDKDLSRDGFLSLRESGLCSF